ncbi:alpha-ketoacid dehydrogenase subunit beta [Candidatus Methylacidithermus pantelleriae]|uniref:Pyruvate dehydrogenase, subunit beta n=1 Tax=Candidatus Methylacidithermus pantelleriae TaxID=2744239 RepID=A0A8J2FPC9_9BACT|nr:alpha-ketoacid dehydrogenase subunit beta [Candidatus Methylacidithermus pantelleriae]CAF0701815.1 Pyruvate dehydrogenase, subunit beta [Candidatus Methylacidithermus pantelleriae]
MREITFREALNEALAEEMERDPKVLLIGEEVGQYQGAYKVSQGLLQRFGPERVLDTPISEAAFTGLGVGAAMAGLRPIVEFMTWSFSLVAFDQIVNNAGAIRYMSGGQFSLGLVLRGPAGGGVQTGATHSHSPENWYANVPSLLVVAPAFPRDAKGLLKTAIRSNNPVCFFEHEILYNVKGPVPEEEYLIPLGKGEICLEGKDVTVIAAGISTHRALEAAKLAAQQGIAVEVVDLRTIKPYDWDLVSQSVCKTHRVVIVEENKPFAGWGAQLAYDIQRKLFDELDAPVARVTSLDVPQPYNERLEGIVLPNPQRILSAIYDVVS